jgi:hypothetical protein
MAKLMLSVSFYGPFIFDFEKDSVTIYVPQCEGHFASVQTDFEEIGLAVDAPQKSYEYRLQQKGGARKPRTPSVHNLDEILHVDPARRKTKPPTAGECQFVLQVPNPDQVIGLVADPISILQYDLPDPGSGAPAHKATSMRFNYYDVDDSEVWELTTVSSGSSTVLQLATKPVPPANYVQLTFRYGSGAPDQGHKDAEQCFQEMRNLFPPLGAWRVRFESPLLLNHLNDCHAAQIAFATPKQVEAWKNQRKANA